MSQGYINGSDLLIKVNNKYIGHATSHTLSMTSDTKDRTVKPAGTITDVSDSLWHETGVTGLKYSINFDGLMHYAESEGSFSDLLDVWRQGAVVDVECMMRGADQPYFKGNCIIASLEHTASADDDATYSGTLESAGKPTITPAKIAPTTLNE